MKKIFALFLISSLGMALASSASAIEDPDPVGTIIIGAHGAYYPGYGANVFGDYVLVDSWWKGHFTVGAQVAFNVYNKPGSEINASDTRICIAPRATYGLNITPQLEVHAGVLLGAGYHKIKADAGGAWKTEAANIQPVHSEILGARFFIAENFAASVEFNYSNYLPYLNAGVAFRF